MKSRINHIKFSISFLLLCLFLLSCRHKSGQSKTVQIDLPYKFKTEKAESLSVEAFSLCKKSKYDEAINLYQQAILIESDNPKLFFDLSECYSNKKELNKAITTLDKALKLDSLNPFFYNNRGLIYWKLYKNDSAISDYKTAIELGSKNWITYFNLSIAYYSDKKMADACQTFKTAKNLGLTTDFISNDKHLTLIEEACH